MLVVDRASGRFGRSDVSGLSFVPPARRLHGAERFAGVSVAAVRASRARHGGRVEVFLTRQVSPDGLTWEALVRPGRKMRTGERIVISEDLTVEILGRGEYRRANRAAAGRRAICSRFSIAWGTCRCRPTSAARIPRGSRRAIKPCSRASEVRWPRPRRGCISRRKFWTHARAAGAAIARVTLHVGLGTFQPLHDRGDREGPPALGAFMVPPESRRVRWTARRA